MLRFEYEVFGRVQGVGFRYTTTDVARHIGSVTGWVRNTDRNTVEGQVQGSRARLDKFLAALEKSPVGRVERVEKKEIDIVEGEIDFTSR